ncbi:hypothetical protein [Flavimaricola marinus]|uniref:Uncharacterized protein n=1 Tax=Flavimaricola marinus TaxID=1819565 RepID=A0A238LEJ1_9RHOB|nr:hypothetical protein [Flavimaricola marinus]SMY08127.1 hypothetical protein LOM8899_02276 [Flavimaricola marinus]
MVTSWLIGRGRVASGVRPSWLAAWGLVAFDFAALLAVFALIFPPLMSYVYAAQPGALATVAIMFMVFFVPMQLVLITASIWASKSRWQDRPEKEDVR